jgi:hypothetical protein
MWSQVCHLSSVKLSVMPTRSADLSVRLLKLSGFVCWVDQALAIYLLSHPSYLELSVWST